MNFRDFDDLIHSGANEIVLDSDIILSDDEESEYLDGIRLDVDNLIIDGNNHSIDACGKARIFLIVANNIAIKNITLKNGFSQKGGAIFNEGDGLSIEKSFFSNNSAQYAEFPVFSMGGAIENSGEMSISESAFSLNRAESGGAIANSGKLTISKSTLCDNSVQSDKPPVFIQGGAVDNDGELSMLGCEMERNLSQKDGGAIANAGRLSMADCLVSNNSSKENGGAITNSGLMEIKDSKVTQNSAEIGGAIYNIDEGIIDDVLFEGNECEHEFAQDIFNEGVLNLIEFKFNSPKKTIFNREYVVIHKNINDKIHNLAEISHAFWGFDNVKTFTYLDELIHSGQRDIILKNDIFLLGFEDDVDRFRDGIVVDVDGITIDGNGHAVSALQLARIFKITGKDVTIKNITLEEGFTRDSGGAIFNEGEATFDNVIFLNNVAREKGGAIHNVQSGEIKIISSRFELNKATKAGTNARTGVSGGAIFNEGKMEIDDAYMICNYAKSAEYPTISNGGAIFNALTGNLVLSDSMIIGNASLIDGDKFNRRIRSGAVCNYGTMTLERCGIINNEAGRDILSNFSKMEMVKCKVENNRIHPEDNLVFERKPFGMIISNGVDFERNEKRLKSVLDINGCDIIGNTAEKILVSHNNVSLIGSNMVGNNAQEVIFNHHRASVIGTSFESNEFEGAGSLNINNDAHLTIKNPKIKDWSYKSILNSKKLIIMNEDLEEIIDNRGTVKIGIRRKEKHDFTKLDEMVSTSMKIVLDHDFAFEDYEIDYFEGGIVLDRDGLIIDGQNHVIDARGMSRIFLVNAKNVILKNIIFRRGHSFRDIEDSKNSSGAAIRTIRDSDLIIESCKFENNFSEMDGGAILNFGMLNLKSTAFYGNNGYDGGAIVNQGSMVMKDCQLNYNRAPNDGGAIVNHGEMRIYESILNVNESSHAGGALVNDGEMLVKNSRLCSNNSSQGGAIFNDSIGNIVVKSSKLLKNGVFMEKRRFRECNGGAISNSGMMIICSSLFEGNVAELEVSNTSYINRGNFMGGAIYNDGCIRLMNSSLLNNASRMGESIDNNPNSGGRAVYGAKYFYYGGAIHNAGLMKIGACNFEGNSAGSMGGAIWGMRKTDIDLEDCEFENNLPDDVYFDG